MNRLPGHGVLVRHQFITPYLVVEVVLVPKLLSIDVGIVMSIFLSYHNDSLKAMSSFSVDNSTLRVDIPFCCFVCSLGNGCKGQVYTQFLASVASLSLTRCVHDRTGYMGSIYIEMMTDA